MTAGRLWLSWPRSWNKNRSAQVPPLPKKKYPKARQRQRRSHIILNLPHLVPCPQCRTLRLPHRACPVCGTYRGRTVVEIEEQRRRPS